MDKITATFVVVGDGEELVRLSLGVKEAEPLDHLTRFLLQGCGVHIMAAADLMGTRPFDSLDHVFVEAMKLLPQYGKLEDG